VDRSERLAEACAQLAAAASALAGVLESEARGREEPGPPDPAPRHASADLGACMADLLAEQRRYGHPFALALFNLDGLGRINDAYGRRAGDLMLAGVAGVLRRQVRGVDRVLRVERDEFAVLAPHTDAEGLASMARRVAGLVARSQDPAGPRIAIAAGVVGCPGDGLAAERLLESATEAIYAAKASGAAVATSPDRLLQDS
jgi:diguanylate cyclase (GGDEF)-like protein